MARPIAFNHAHLEENRAAIQTPDGNVFSVDGGVNFESLDEWIKYEVEAELEREKAPS